MDRGQYSSYKYKSLSTTVQDVTGNMQTSFLLKHPQNNLHFNIF